VLRGSTGTWRPHEIYV